MDRNQYIWFYENYRMYEYNTDEAKQLRDKIGAIDMTDGSDVSADETLTDAYNSFVKKFDNNPFNYLTGTKDSQISCSNLDGYLIDYGGDLIPIGYFKEEDPLECRIVTEKFIGKTMADIGKDFIRLKSDLKTKTNRIEYKQQEVELKGKKAGATSQPARTYKAVIALVSAVASILSVIHYFVRIKIWRCFKYILKPSFFADTARESLSGIPFFEGWGFAVWLIVFIIAILLTVYSVKNLIRGVKELKNGLMWEQTKKVPDIVRQYLNGIDNTFAEYVANEADKYKQNITDGNVCVLTRGEIANNLEIIKRQIERSTEFLDKGIDNAKKRLFTKFTIGKLCVAAALALLSVCVIGYASKPVYKIERRVAYDVRSGLHNAFLRVDDYYLTNHEDVYIYAGCNIDSRKKIFIADEWTPVIKVSEKQDRQGNNWTKVIYIDGERYVKGWTLSKYITKYYRDFSKTQKIEATTFSGNANASEVWRVVDGDIANCWNNGGASDARISMSFSGIRHMLAGLQIYAGCGVSRGDYKSHARLKTITIETEKDKIKGIALPDYYDGVQTILFNKPVETSNLTIIVDEVYGGDTDNIVYIGECQPIEYIEGVDNLYSK